MRSYRCALPLNIPTEGKPAELTPLLLAVQQRCKHLVVFVHHLHSSVQDGIADGRRVRVDNYQKIVVGVFGRITARLRAIPSLVVDRYRAGVAVDGDQLSVRDALGAVADPQDRGGCHIPERRSIRAQGCCPYR